MRFFVRFGHERRVPPLFRFSLLCPRSNASLFRSTFRVPGGTARIRVSIYHEYKAVEGVVSMMAVETAEPRSTEAGSGRRLRRSGKSFLETTEDNDFSTTAAAGPERRACHTWHRKRRRSVTESELSPIDTSRKRSCRFDDRVAATMNSRTSGRPASARHAARQDRDKDWTPRRHLHRRRPHSAIRTEYLGVSSAVFAPPLRRYLESPQRGRRALRSPTPSCTTRSSARHSPPTSPGHFAGEFPSATAQGRTGRPVPRGHKERDRRARLLWQEGGTSTCSASHNVDVEPRALRLDAPDGESLEDFAGTRVGWPLGTRPPAGLLTPVGPDWWVASLENQAKSTPTSTTADSDAGDDSGDGIDQQLVARGEERHSVVGDAGNENGDSHHSSHQEKPHCDDDGGEDRHKPTYGADGSLERPTIRGGRRRWRGLRSSAWDLLTGRRVERGRRKGSGDIRADGVSSFDSKDSLRHVPAQAEVLSATSVS